LDTRKRYVTLRYASAHRLDTASHVAGRRRWMKECELRVPESQPRSLGLTQSRLRAFVVLEHYLERSIGHIEFVLGFDRFFARPSSESELARLGRCRGRGRGGRQHQCHAENTKKNSTTQRRSTHVA